MSAPEAMAVGALPLADGLALIFDLDGVVVDSMPVHTLAWQRYLELLGVQGNDVERRMHGRRNDELVRDLLGPEVDPQVVFEHGAAKERLFREMMGAQLTNCLVPGVELLLKRAHAAGVPVALATNAEPANVNFVLDGAGLRRYFRVVVDGTQVERAKPAPDVFLRAAELLGIEPGNCIVFEDSPIGVEAALKAGARVVGVLTQDSGLANIDIGIEDFLQVQLESWLAVQHPQ